MIDRPDSDLASTREGWNRSYVEGYAPWDIGRPQPAFVGLAEAGEIRSPALDSGCGTGLAAALEPGGVLHLLCFSDRVPGDVGPRRVSQAELHDAFGTGWQVERIEDAEFEVSADFPVRRPHAWLAHIVRRA